MIIIHIQFVSDKLVHHVPTGPYQYFVTGWIRAVLQGEIIGRSVGLSVGKHSVIISSMQHTVC